MILVANIAATACLLVALAYTWRIRRNGREIDRITADLQAMTARDRDDLALGAVVRKHMEAGTLLDLLTRAIDETKGA